MIQFDQYFQKSLPLDRSKVKASRPLKGYYAALTDPTPVKNPEILIWSSNAAQLIDEPNPKSKDGVEAHVFSGNQLLSGMEPYAVRYGGHQFGQWAGQLGDGRAIALGEGLNHRNERYEIQLKGAGPTPFSRGSDGRAVLRSSLREFLCSEAMFHLGVPTTRALCCVKTGDEVVRDLFYDGNPKAEPGAITTRIAPSFLRFGNFEIFAANQEIDNLKKLIQETIRIHFPRFNADSDQGIADWFQEVAQRTAQMIVEWMRVGFVHGVMNTDNLSILGLTIDYGPYGWIDAYDLGWTPNTTDESRKRYRFGNQPSIGLWNLTRLAEAIATTLADPQILTAGLDTYRREFEERYQKMRLQKIGLQGLDFEASVSLIDDLDQALSEFEIDMTMFYRKLADFNLDAQADITHFIDAFYDRKNATQGSLLKGWLTKYREKVLLSGMQPVQLKTEMDKVNPYFVLRNYLAQEAIEVVEKNQDSSVLDALYLALQTPYEENGATRRFYSKRPEWARNKAGCSALSCSS